MSDVGQEFVPDPRPRELSPEDDAVWLSGDDFATEDAATDGLAFRPADEVPARSPGPGLPESLAWMGGMLGLQIVGGIVAVAVVVFLYLADTGALSRPNQDLRSALNSDTLRLIQREYAGTLFGVIQIVTVIGAATAVAVRLGRERYRLLPLTGIPWRHVALIFAAVLPLVVLSSQLHVCGSWAWGHVTDAFPRLKPVDELSSMAAVERLARQTSFLGLLFMVAVAPALAEELVFRGAIGRGLIARWGLPAGVLLTSLLFAAMHVHPPHVFALLPLAVFLHVVYVATRSFWAPVLVHFLNNALAVVALSWMLELPETTQKLDSPRLSLLMLLSSGFCVATLIVTLWRSRVQFVQWDGTEWSPGYPAVEHPPEELQLRGHCRPTELSDWAPAAVGLGVFAVGVVMFGVLSELGWHV